MLKRNIELSFSKDELEDNGWFAADLLDRGPHVKAITGLLLTTEGEFVMTLSSPWGTGKTTFIQMWKTYLEHLGHPCVLFNAWQHDYAENPFLTFIAEMHEQLYSLGGRGQEARRTALTKMRTAGKKLFPKLLSVGVKAGLGVSVDFQQLGKDLLGVDGFDMKKVGENLTQVLSDSAEAFASDVLKEHKETKALVDKFKKHLEKVVDNLGDQKKPMFFFVDELDRCKPTYAIELLEAIKHLFETRGIIFVLLLDREQLGHSVRAAYGDGIDSDGYLRRFIDLEYRIPEPGKADFIKHLGEIYGIANYPFFLHCRPRGALQTFLNEFNEIATNHSLRTIEKAFLRGTVLLRGLQSLDREGIAPKGLAHFIFLRELLPNRFDRCMKGKKLISLNDPEEGAILSTGIKPTYVDLFVKHRGHLDKNGFDLRQLGDEGMAFRNDVIFMTNYLETHGEHLLDAVERLLDLSGQLVSEGQ